MTSYRGKDCIPPYFVMNALYVQIYTYDIYVYIDCAYAAICCTVINVYCYNFGSLRKSKLHLAFFKTETRKIGKHKKNFIE